MEERADREILRLVDDQSGVSLSNLYWGELQMDQKNKSVKSSKGTKEADREWRQFVRQELESARNPGKTGQDRTSRDTESGASSLPSLDQAVSLIADKIPFERLIDSTVQFFMKKTGMGKKSKKRKKKR